MILKRLSILINILCITKQSAVPRETVSMDFMQPIFTLLKFYEMTEL